MNTAPSLNTKLTAPEHDIGEQINALRNDLAKLTSTLGDDVSRGVASAGHQINQAGRDVQKTATTAVLDHPLAAIGIAASIGLLLGLVARKA